MKLAKRQQQQGLRANGQRKLASPSKDAKTTEQVAETANGSARDGVVVIETSSGGVVEKPKRYVTLLPSVFEDRPPVIFFSYTEACKAKQRDMERAESTPEDAPRLFYSHTDAVHEYNAVVNILRQGGLYRVRPDSQKWTLLWSHHPPPEVLNALKPLQKTNHHIGSWHLGKKDLIWKNLQKMVRRFGEPYEITPTCYLLPVENQAWEVSRKQRPDALWIWKPCSQSCGRGIKVLSNSMSEEESRRLLRKRGLVQRYLHNPLTINGYKFDLRIYVVVLSYDPLKVYINDEGLVRIATEKYNLSADTLDARTMHLTNYSVNKLSAAFVQNKDGKKDDSAAAVQEDGEAPPGEETQAFKWSLTELQEHFRKEGLDYNAMFNGIKDMAIKTLIAVEPQIREEWSKAFGKEQEGWSATSSSGGAHRGSCFEMYGFDVMIDKEMKPWLLEVNICPSLSSGSPLDKRIKTKLVADTLTLTGIRPPPALWRQNKGTKRSAEQMESGEVSSDNGQDQAVAPPAPAGFDRAALEARASRLLACDSALQAVSLFEKLEWELVLDSLDEDMRSGGLERIFPCAHGADYTPFLEEESYSNLVLRRWHEAGGGELFKRKDAQQILPSWLPKQISFTRT